MLLGTTDGGATWRSDLSLPNMQPLFVGFSSASSGWIVADGNVNEVMGAVVSSTANGGQTWSTPVALPQDSGFFDFDYGTFAALAPQGGQSAVLMENDWVIGGDSAAATAWRTTDGGATWSAPTRLKGADIVDATFASPSVGWATDSNGSGWLWHTSNGGASWKKLRKAPNFAKVTTVGNNVWVVGRGTLHSSNGGATWRAVPGLLGRLVSFSSPADGWIANGSVYLHTTNGGATWRPATSAPQPGVNHLVAVPGRTVWGVAGRAIKSTDAGLRWRSVTKRAVTAVAAVSTLQAWAVGGKGLIIHTTDGGNHWRQQPSGVTAALRNVFFLDARHGWAGGDHGTLLRTTDGGRRWSHQRQASGGSIRQVAFGNASHVIAVGTFAPTFLVTSNGGRTWSKERLPAGRWPTVVIMQNASHAVIVALQEPHAYSFTSADGGKTWQQTGNLPDGVDYSAIARSGSLLCAVDAEGGVATSRDDAATWSDLGVPMGGALNSVQFVGNDELMIGGSLGVMTRNLVAAPLP